MAHNWTGSSSLAFNWTNWTPLGSTSGAPVTDQGDLNTCVAHALAKGIFDIARNIEDGYKGCTDEDSATKALAKELEEHPWMRKDGIDVIKFNNYSIEMVDNKDVMTFGLTIKAVERNRERFASNKQWSNFISNSSSFLVIRAESSIFDPNNHGYHAVYAEAYNPNSNIFNCVNSWGKDENPFPRISADDKRITHAYRVYVNLSTTTQTRSYLSMTDVRADSIIKAPAGCEKPPGNTNGKCSLVFSNFQQELQDPPKKLAVTNLFLNL